MPGDEDDLVDGATSATKGAAAANLTQLDPKKPVTDFWKVLPETEHEVTECDNIFTNKLVSVAKPHPVKASNDCDHVNAQKALL